MKTRLIILLLLIVSFSCGTNKTVSDTEKDKIRGKVKEIVHAIFKGAEEANFDMVVETWYDSPDFVYMCNGKTYTYKECLDEMKQFLSVLLNQKCTIVDEKYAVLDNSTVLGTINTKWLMNYKDGHSVLQDPWAVQFTFKKIDNRWRVIYHVESGVEKNVINSESSKGLNQAELLKKFVGSWEIPLGKDTSEFVVIKSLQGGNCLNVYAKWATKGKLLFEGSGFWGYDATIKKIDISIMLSTGYIVHDLGEFTSPNTMEFVNINNAAPYKGVSKCMLEFISPDEIKETTLKDNKAEIVIWKRLK
jgi:hypothetical protein